MRWKLQHKHKKSNRKFIQPHIAVTGLTTMLPNTEFSLLGNHEFIYRAHFIHKGSWKRIKMHKRQWYNNRTKQLEDTMKTQINLWFTWCCFLTHPMPESIPNLIRRADKLIVGHIIGKSCRLWFVNLKLGPQWSDWRGSSDLGLYNWTCHKTQGA